MADEGVVYADEGGLGNSDYEGAKYARGAAMARGEHHESKDGHVELVADEGVVYADEGSALDPEGDPGGFSSNFRPSKKCSLQSK